MVRNFIKGTDGPWAGDFASAVCGSPNIYAQPIPHESDWWGNNGGKQWRGGRGPSASVNFVTAHDGFTLADVVGSGCWWVPVGGPGDWRGFNVVWAGAACGRGGVAVEKQETPPVVAADILGQ